MAISNTSICNLALADVGIKRINNFENSLESSSQAIACRLHFEPTRDALVRSHYWRFASARQSLSQDTCLSRTTFYGKNLSSVIILLHRGI